MDVKVMLWFDVEDYITPQADDALNALIDMMDKRGIQSSLKIVAEKARALKERGRYDIINKFAGHEICYHTDNHSRHPTITEYLEGYGFADGAQEFVRREEKGLRDVNDITGQFATSYGQPGAAWGAQVSPALRKWGIQTYLDENDAIDVDGNPFWYGGVLYLTKLYATMRMDYNDKDGLEKAKAEFDRLCTETQAEQTQLVSIYYHPCEFSSTQFWDGVNFSRGKNPPKSEWKPSPLRTADEMHAIINTLGMFIDYTLSKENVEYITASEVLKYEITGNTKTVASDIIDFTHGVGDDVNFAKVSGSWRAPSELMSLMASFISEKHLSPILSYGPEKDVPSHVVGMLKVGEIAKAVEEQYERVFGYRQLPDVYKVGNSLVNPTDAFCTLACAISSRLNAEDIITVRKGNLSTAKYVKSNDSWDDWVVFPIGFKATNTIRMAKLQAWTLKPASY